jgi:uncharacterized membrane protein (DUF2068 family)
VRNFSKNLYVILEKIFINLVNYFHQKSIIKLSMRGGLKLVKKVSNILNILQHLHIKAENLTGIHLLANGFLASSCQINKIYPLFAIICP